MLATAPLHSVDVMSAPAAGFLPTGFTHLKGSHFSSPTILCQQGNTLGVNTYMTSVIAQEGSVFFPFVLDTKRPDFSLIYSK